MKASLQCHGKVEKEFRLHKVHHLMLKGYSAWDIQRYGERKGWDVTYMTTRHYMNLVLERMKGHQFRHRSALLIKHVAMRELLYQRLYHLGEYAQCLAVLKDLAQIQGMYIEKKEVELKGAVGLLDLKNMTNAQLESFIAEMEIDSEQAVFEEVDSEDSFKPALNPGNGKQGHSQSPTTKQGQGVKNNEPMGAPERRVTSHVSNLTSENSEKPQLKRVRPKRPVARKL